MRCTGEFPIDAQWGKFTLTTFEDLVDGQIQYALHQGDLTAADLPVRIQPINTLRDVLGTRLPQGSQGWSYESAMAYIAEQGRACRNAGRLEVSEAIMRNIAELAGEAAAEAPPQNYRVIGTGAQILRGCYEYESHVCTDQVQCNLWIPAGSIRLYLATQRS